MINHITHAGVLHVDDVVHADNRRNLLISILDFNSPHDRPDFSKFEDVLALSFKDRCEEDYGHDYYWPDQPTANFNYSLLRMANENVFSLADAVKIVDFVERWIKDPNEFNLIVHCKSGVGRSAAIAEFFGIIHNIPFSGTDPRGRFMPNCRVSRLLTKAYHNKYNHASNGSNTESVQQLDLSKRCYITS